MSASERRKQLIDTQNLLIDFVRHVRQRRALQKPGAKPHLVFWILINNALFDAAVLGWCKLFGSDDEARQPTQ